MSKETDAALQQHLSFQEGADPLLNIATGIHSLAGALWSCSRELRSLGLDLGALGDSADALKTLAEKAKDHGGVLEVDIGALDRVAAALEQLAEKAKDQSEL